MIRSIVLAAIFGALVAGLATAWRRRRQRANWLEITPKTISLRGPKSVDDQHLSGTPGERLQFVIIGPARGRSFALKVRGGETVLALHFFNKKSVQQACVAHGWSFD